MMQLCVFFGYLWYCVFYYILIIIFDIIMFFFKDEVNELRMRVVCFIDEVQRLVDRQSGFYFVYFDII